MNKCWKSNTLTEKEVENVNVAVTLIHQFYDLVRIFILWSDPLLTIYWQIEAQSKKFSLSL